MNHKLRYHKTIKRAPIMIGTPQTVDREGIF